MSPVSMNCLRPCSPPAKPPVAPAAYGTGTIAKHETRNGFPEDLTYEEESWRAGSRLADAQLPALRLPAAQVLHNTAMLC
jgi:hypothetical protein